VLGPDVALERSEVHKLAIATEVARVSCCVGGGEIHEQVGTVIGSVVEGSVVEGSVVEGSALDAPESNCGAASSTFST
ncbi:MAG: hypothetical protein ACC652_07185, partial [Acidimicrobiales bacterium]